MKPIQLLRIFEYLINRDIYKEVRKYGCLQLCC